ncbi:MAG: 2TM domain-containing protein [Flavobacteriaceae bacterium]|nr:2TM domain-containing protein [Flavobacteriaceae bacterium]
MENFDKENRYLRAKERVEEIKKFYSSLIMYVLVIGFLAVINYYTNGWEYKWFLWAAFGWGIGIVFRALRVFRLNPFFNREWEERKIREFMDQDSGATKNTRRWE